MNLHVLMVWYGILMTYSTAVPRRRNFQHPATKLPNSSQERSPPTALEYLEKNLLRPNEKPRLHPRFARKRNARMQYQIHNGEVTSMITNRMPMNFDKFPNNFYAHKRRLAYNKCVAAFGKDSPLCKSKRRRKKSFMSFPERYRKKFRFGTVAIKSSTPSNISDDFFGLFTKTSTNLSTSNKVSQYNIYNLFGNTDELTTTIPPISQRGPRQAGSKELITKISTNNVVQTTGSAQSKSSPSNSTPQISSVASKIIVPGNLEQVESKLKLMYLDQNKNDKDNLKIRKLEGEEHDVSLSESSMEGEETTHNEEPDSEQATENHLTIQTTIFAALNTLISLLSGPIYDKHTCEKEKNTECICSFSSLENDFSTILSTAKSEELTLAAISSLTCRQYVPKPSMFDLNTNTKPRVILGKDRPLPVDSDMGPKEVTEESLNSFIEQAAITDNITRVFVSSSVKLSCFPIMDLYLSASDSDQVKYTWTYDNQNKKEEITQGRVNENIDGSGTLAIENVELTDTKNYTCEIDYIHPDTGHRTIEKFTHSLMVVTLPIVSVRVTVHYKSTAVCDSGLLEMFELYLPQQIEKALCDPGTGGPYFCSVQVHSPVCHTNSPEREKRQYLPFEPSYLYRVKREESMDMSLNIEVYVHKPAVKGIASIKPTICDPKCFLLIHVKLVEFFKQNMEELAQSSVTTKVQGGGTFTPIPSSIKLKYIFGCIGGYYLDDGFCLACPKGTYSDDGATECKPCPEHTYSIAIGARKCIPCRHLWVPICNEYFENVNIGIIFFILLTVSILLLAFVGWYNFFHKGRTWKDVVHKHSKVKLAKSERISRRKKKKLEEEEMSLLGTSGESEPEPPERKNKKKVSLKKNVVPETSVGETSEGETHHKTSLLKGNKDKKK